MLRVSVRTDRVEYKSLTYKMHSSAHPLRFYPLNFYATCGEVVHHRIHYLFGCGYAALGISEIARALLVAEETVKKRLQRATLDLVDHDVSLEPPEESQLIERLEVVHQVLYLIFNEGYSC